MAPRSVVRAVAPSQEQLANVPDAGTAAAIEALRDEVNRIATLLQTGALLLGGLKLETSATAAPTVAPARGQPNLRLVSITGTIKLYVWDGSAWVVVGTQT